MKIFLAQLNLTIGDFENNFIRIADSFQKAEEKKADLIIFPEMAISSYPVQDMILRHSFCEENEKYLQKIVALTQNHHCAILIGSIHKEKEQTFNAAFVIQNGEIKNLTTKHILPNFSIFDESRHFTSKIQNNHFTIAGRKFSILICRDAWSENLCENVIENDSDFIITINASPFEKNKFNSRIKLALSYVEKYQKPFLYVNLVGGQDHVIFDGGSFALNEKGSFLNEVGFFKENLVEINLNSNLTFQMPKIDDQRLIYEALMMSLRDYVGKNGFKSVVFGLSGGIDSALTCAIAIDALGKNAVHAVTLPSKFSSTETFLDASMCQKLMDIQKIDEIAIQTIVDEVEKTLAPFFIGKERDKTEENLQARIRGLILMALSNKFGSMLLTTGNKSELATGYATLYGDMCGSYNLLKDLYKTEVFALAKWRNQNFPNNALGNHGMVIPENVINKAPTAELNFNQKDSDSLPPYDILDAILVELIENELSINETAQKLSFDEKIVSHVAFLIKSSEFKRTQAAPGARLSLKSFNNGDRKFPITNKFLY